MRWRFLALLLAAGCDTTPEPAPEPEPEPVALAWLLDPTASPDCAAETEARELGLCRRRLCETWYGEHASGQPGELAQLERLCRQLVASDLATHASNDLFCGGPACGMLPALDTTTTRALLELEGEQRGLETAQFMLGQALLNDPEALSRLMADAQKDPTAPLPWLPGLLAVAEREGQPSSAGPAALHLALAMPPDHPRLRATVSLAASLSFPELASDLLGCALDAVLEPSRREACAVGVQLGYKRGDALPHGALERIREACSDGAEPEPPRQLCWVGEQPEGLIEP